MIPKYNLNKKLIPSVNTTEPPRCSSFTLRYVIGEGGWEFCEL